VRLSADQADTNPRSAGANTRVLRVATSITMSPESPEKLTDRPSGDHAGSVAATPDRGTTPMIACSPISR